MISYFRALCRAEEIQALEALHAFTVETSLEYKRDTAKEKHQSETLDINSMHSTFTNLHASKPVNKMTFVPAKWNARHTREKFVVKGMLRVPNGNKRMGDMGNLRRMSSATDQLANAMEYKPQATRPIAEQIVSLVKHDAKLMEQAEKARAAGNVVRVSALVKQIEANRKLCASYVEQFNETGATVLTDGYVAGFALMPSSEKSIPMGKPLPRKEYRKGQRDAVTVSKAYPVKSITLGE
jgi:hypothetical protein